MSTFRKFLVSLWLSLALAFAGAPQGNCNACKGGSSKSRSASTARKGASGRKVYARTRTSTGVHERHVGTATKGNVIVMTPRATTGSAKK